MGEVAMKSLIGTVVSKISQNLMRHKRRRGLIGILFIIIVIILMIIGKEIEMKAALLDRSLILAMQLFF